MSKELANPIELRVQNSYLATSIVCAIGFALIGTVSVFVAAVNIDDSFPNPIPMAVFFGVFWGAWLAASLYTILACYREKLTVTSQSITQEGVFRTRNATISEITSAKWRAWPVGGSIVIRYPNTRIKIHFDNFLSHERELLIARLRELITEECQENWDVFVSEQLPAPSHPQKSRTTAILCMASFFIVGSVFVYCWHIQFGLKFLVIGVACGGVGLWYLFRILKFVPDSELEPTA